MADDASSLLHPNALLRAVTIDGVAHFQRTWLVNTRSPIFIWIGKDSWINRTMTGGFDRLSAANTYPAT